MDKDKIKKIILYFSLPKQREREHQKYLKKIKEFENMSETEFESEYIRIKTKYESKKRNIALFGVAIFLFVISKTVSNFFLFLKEVFKFFLIEQKNVEITKVIFILSSVGVIMIILLTIFLFLIFLKDLEDLYKNLLIITEYKKKRK